MTTATIDSVATGRAGAGAAAVASAPARVTLVARRYKLSGEVAVVYDARVDGTTEVTIRVHFPDETRALLETISWSSGRSIHTVLDEVAQKYLQRLLDAGVLAASRDDASTSGTANDSLMPLTFFRTALAKAIDV